MYYKSILKKHGVICPVRKINSYRKMMKLTKEYTILQ